MSWSRVKAKHARQVIQELEEAGLETFETPDGGRGVRLDTYLPSKEGQRAVRVILIRLGHSLVEGYINTTISRDGSKVTGVYLTQRGRAINPLAIACR